MRRMAPMSKQSCPICIIRLLSKMYFFKINRILVFIFLWWLTRAALTDAKITIFDWNGNMTLYSTSDYFLYRTPYYRYQGIALFWRFQNTNSTEKCKIESINNLDPYIQKLSKMALAYPNFAVAINYNDFEEAGCTNKQQVNTAINSLSNQLKQVNFPGVELLILLDGDGRIITWNDESIAYNVNPIFDDVLRFSPIKVTSLYIRNDTITYMDDTGDYHIFRYTAEQETGPWNKIFYQLAIAFTSGPTLL
ncbi:hypothetical protein BDF19DRAFT_462905 [Syncephalis fuscata]|nr:hypothetical protein BDF19DRAFT_462905 [Syncephalis fuscata]